MDLTPEDIKEFQTLWEQEFGEPLADGDAEVVAGNLLRLYEFLAASPSPQE